MSGASEAFRDIPLTKEDRVKRYEDECEKNRKKCMATKGDIDLILLAIKELKQEMRNK